MGYLASLEYAGASTIDASELNKTKICFTQSPFKHRRRSTENMINSVARANFEHALPTVGVSPSYSTRSKLKLTSPKISTRISSRMARSNTQNAIPLVGERGGICKIINGFVFSGIMRVITANNGSLTNEKGKITLEMHTALLSTCRRSIPRLSHTYMTLISSAFNRDPRQIAHARELKLAQPEEYRIAERLANWSSSIISPSDTSSSSLNLLLQPDIGCPENAPMKDSNGKTPSTLMRK